MTEYVYGKIDGLGETIGNYSVLTMEVPWNLVKDRIGGKPKSVVNITGLEHDYLDNLVEKSPHVDTVVGIGGGVATDSAKYFAWKRKCSLVLCPTIVSVNAYATPAAAVREKDGRVNYTGKVSPDKVVIDYHAIQSAPARLNTAGTGDIYSCRTALFDWRLARDKNGEAYDEKIATGSQNIIDRLVANAAEVKKVSERGIRTLVELHIETNRLQVLAGTPRPEEGSEHIYFYTLEDLTGRSFVHGEAVGTGIFVLTHFQTKEEDHVASVMDSMGLMFRPQDYGVTHEEFVQTLIGMKKYAREKNLFFSVVDTVDITKDDAEALWRKLSR